MEDRTGQEGDGTVTLLAVKMNVSDESIHLILIKNMALKEISAKFVPKLLTIERISFLKRSQKKSANSDLKLLNTIITGD